MITVILLTISWLGRKTPNLQLSLKDKPNVYRNNYTLSHRSKIGKTTSNNIEELVKTGWVLYF